MRHPDITIPELDMLQRLLDRHHDMVRVQELAKIPVGNQTFPLLGVSLGSTDPKANSIGIFAGVHGLERVGTQVLNSFLTSLLARRAWDERWAAFFEHNRLVTIPVVNPAGFALHTRSNGNGVDLMRNAPIEAEGKTMIGVGGQRFSPRLPWFRGQNGKREIETDAVAQFVREQLFNSPSLITLDIHSGFGMKDRIWYPWAKCHAPFPHAAQVQNLFKLFTEAYPHHVYIIEAQNESYTTHGDLWDWLYMQHQELHPGRPYLPLALEMGSWSWVRKNPLQSLNLEGFFNPVKLHRHARTMRRHLLLLDFLISASAHPFHWS